MPSSHAADTMGDRILRIKGLLNVVGDHKPRVVQCVQHVNYPYSPARRLAGRSAL
jgi:hypothetical protein